MSVRYPFYFGCIREAGHYWFERSSGNLVFAHGRAPHELHHAIDGLFCPPDTVEEGVANLVHVNVGHAPATILSFWDNSIDSRPGSHSTFVLPGALSFVTALDYAKKAFPEVFARFKFTVTAWRP